MAKGKPDAGASLGRRTRHENPKAQQVLDSLAEEETQRLHVFIPKSMHQKLKRRAFEGETTISAETIEALRQYLEG